MNYVIPVGARKFFCQHRNGDNFTDNPSDFTTYFQGEIREKFRLEVTYDVYTITTATAFSQITVFDAGAKMGLTLPATTWDYEGFVVGDSVIIESGGVTRGATVDSVLGSTMYLSSLTDLIAVFGFVDGASQSDLTIKVTTQPEGLVFKFGIQPNSLLSSSFNSLLDGQEQAYSLNNFSGTYLDLNYLADNSSDLGGVRYKYDGVSGTGNYIFRFTVQHDFRMPHYIIDWLTAYSSGSIPAAFAGTESFRYLSQLRFAKNILNPNDKKIFNDAFELGSVGFQNQNFNGGAVNYELISIDYNTGEAPEVTTTTTVTAQIKKTNGDFDDGIKLYLYHSKLPQESEYKENTNTFDYNFLTDQLFVFEGVGSSSSVIINNFEGNKDVDESIIQVSFDLTYPDTDRLINGDYITLQLAVEEDGLTPIESDRVLIGLDTVQVTKDSDITGLAADFNAVIKERSSGDSATNINTWINRCVEVDFNFDITKGLGKEALSGFLTGLKFDLVAWNTTTDEFFSLDSYSFPIGFVPQVNVGGGVYQLLNIDTTRFLSVPISDQLREVQLEMSAPGSYQTTQEVSGKLGFIVPWQEWIQNPDVPTVFYDGAIPDEFYNLNNRTSNYSGVEGYQIYIFLTASILSEPSGLNTNYILFSDASSVYDFEEDGDGTGWATDSIKVLNADDEELGDFDGTQPNKIEVIASNPDLSSISAQSLRAEIVIEPKNNTGRHYRLHSSLNWLEAGNPLYPVSGETNVKIDVDVPGGTVTLTCMCDGTLLNPLKSYNIYYHIYE